MASGAAEVLATGGQYNPLKLFAEHLIYLPPLLLSMILLSALPVLVRLLIRQYRSPLRELRGPNGSTLLLGVLPQMYSRESSALVLSWVAQYGTAFAYRGFLGGRRLMLADPRAIAHVLGNAYDYPKPTFVRDSLAGMCGHHGVLTTEGEQHRRQRRVLSPAFSVASIKAVTPIFWDTASELRDIWMRIIDEGGQCLDSGAIDNKDCAGARINVLPMLSRAALDVIGLAGFGYAFNALTNEVNELAKAFASVFKTTRTFHVMGLLQTWFPFLRAFASRIRRAENKAEARARAMIEKTGLRLIEERTEAILTQSKLMEEKPNIQRKFGNDILSVLIRSSLSSSTKQRLSMEEMLCQITTFVAAGHDTTACSIVWALYALASNPEAQKSLRLALQALPSSSNSDLTDAVLRCIPLDWTVREVLRLYAPVASTMRVCECPEGKDEIPLSRPVTDRMGRPRSSVRVNKGDLITIPIAVVNRWREIWGPDADEFRPERWADPPATINAVPGLWSNVLTFLNGNPVNGNRSCIGYRFALAEIKIFLYVLLCDLDFSIDKEIVIERKVSVIMRPLVQSEPENGYQMPLRIRRAIPSLTSPS